MTDDYFSNASNWVNLSLISSSCFFRAACLSSSSVSLRYRIERLRKTECASLNTRVKTDSRILTEIPLDRRNACTENHNHLVYCATCTCLLVYLFVTQYHPAKTCEVHPGKNILTNTARFANLTVSIWENL